MPDLATLDMMWTAQGNLVGVGRIVRRVCYVSPLRLTLWWLGSFMWFILFIEQGGKPQRSTKPDCDALRSVLTTRLLLLAFSAATVSVRALLWANRVELRACGRTFILSLTVCIAWALWLLTWVLLPTTLLCRTFDLSPPSVEFRPGPVRLLLDRFVPIPVPVVLTRLCCLFPLWMVQVVCTLVLFSDAMWVHRLEQLGDRKLKGLPVVVLVSLMTRLTIGRTRLRLNPIVFSTLLLDSLQVLDLITTMVLWALVMIRLRCRLGPDCRRLTLRILGPRIQVLRVKLICVVVTGFTKGMLETASVVEVVTTVMTLGLPIRLRDSIAYTISILPPKLGVNNGWTGWLTR